MNSQYKQQGGFILALALLMMLFVGVIVVSSIDRTGAEQRVATSVMHKPSLESAAEAGIYTARSRVGGPASGCTTGTMTQQCSCNWSKLNDDDELKDLLDLGGYGVDSAKMTYTGGNGQPDIGWWVDTAHSGTSEACVASRNLSFVVSAQQGADSNVMSIHQMRTTVNFIPDPNSPFNPFFENRGLMSLDPVEFGNNAKICDKGNGISCNSENAKIFPSANLTHGSILSPAEQQIFVNHFRGMEQATFPVPLSSNTSLTLPGSYTVPPGSDKVVTLLVTGNSRLTIDMSDTNYFYNIIVADGFSPEIVLSTNGQPNLFNGFIYAPDSTVRITNGQSAFASMIAKKIDLQNASDLYLLDLDKIVPGDQVIADFTIDYSF
jgi:hypothetical protein